MSLLLRGRGGAWRDLDPSGSARGDLRPGKFGDLSKGPSEPVHQHYRGPLTTRQGLEGGNKAGLDARFFLLVDGERDDGAPSSGAALAHPEQVAGSVVHLRDAIPILPGESQGVGRRLTTPLPTVCSHECRPQARFVLDHESRELLVDLGRAGGLSLGRRHLRVLW
jgi:hypothetical protein